MNLKELTQEVNSALDYNPDLAAYKDQVARVLNRHYLQISSQYPWLFRQKREKLTLRADISGKTTTNDDGSVTNNSVLSVGDVSESFDASNVIRFIGTSQALPTREMLGNTLIVNDNDTYTTPAGISHGASEREFTIIGIFDIGSSTVDYGSQGRYGGADDDEWPDGYQPRQFGGVVLDRPIIDPSTASSTSLTTKDYYTDWKIEFRQYYLPADCIEVMGIMDRGLKTPVHSESSGSISTTVNTAPGKGRIIFLDSSKEEYLYLDRDNSGDPVVGIEGMPVHHDAPMLAPLVEPGIGPDLGHIHSSLSAHGSRCSLTGGSTYEYCYTFVYAGVESPPSPVTRVTMGEGLKDPHLYPYFTIIFTQSVEGTFVRDGTRGPTEVSMTERERDDEGADALYRMTGRIKRMYRRKVEDGGLSDKAKALASLHQGHQRWMHIGDIFTDARVIDIGAKQLSFSTAGAFSATFPDEYNGPSVLGWPEAAWIQRGYWTYHDGELSKLKVLDESGPRQTIRVYRPPNQDMDVEIRYLSRPKRLVADADTPEWPVQYHHLLVYKALEDVCLQHGMTSQSQLYERKAEDLLDRMRQKYLARTNRKYVRLGFDKSVFAGERWGTPSKIE